jgi:hypothetical protein
MPLRLLERIRLLCLRAIGSSRPPSVRLGAQPGQPAAQVSSRGSHRRTRRRPSVPADGSRGLVSPRGVAPPGQAPTAPGFGRARGSIRSSAVPGGASADAGRAPNGTDAGVLAAGPVSPPPGSGPGRGAAAGPRPQVGIAGSARVAIRTRHAGSKAADRQRVLTRQAQTAEIAQSWFEPRQARQAAGTRHCGCLEDILVRDWAPEERPVPATVTAIRRLADLPQLIKEKLASGLEAIYVGAGGVPDLDDMAQLKGVLLPSGRATWDACAGAYGDRKIVVGSRPSPTPDVMCHEIGHALDDLDGKAGVWQSDSADFGRLYQRCLPRMASDFHRHSGPLGRREFFADAFAAIASGQRPALVEMLSGDTRTALDVMLYFNVRYGI